MNMLWKTKKSSPSSQKILRLKQALQTADAVIIGAGAGLSASAGFVYDGKRFQTYFSDFEAKYGFHDMYSGGFYPYATLEEHWHTGADIFISIVIWMLPNLFIMISIS